MSKGQYLTPAKAARGLGSAKSGTNHHIRQRVSAIALIFLVPWFLYSVIKAALGGYSEALAWVGSPVNSILLILTAGAAIYHMRLGMQVVIEDYFHTRWVEVTQQVGVRFAVYGAMLAALLAILRLFIG